MKKTRALFAAAGAALGAMGAVWTYRTYRRQRRTAITRLRRGSLIKGTTFGPVEYTQTGEGPPVLVVHGGGGGYDQGLVFSFPEWGFSFLCVSRPGYLRTPLMSGRSPEAQADVLAALLDALSIQSAAVLGFSAGGPSALQFALQHPDRCWGLVLVAAINGPIHHLPFSVPFIESIPHGDFIPWLVTSTPLSRILTQALLRGRLDHDAEKEALFWQMLHSNFPISSRVSGGLNDLKQLEHMKILPFEGITAPTLVIHGDSDPIVPFFHGQRAANHIPGAQFLPIEGGDHLAFITQLERTKPALRSFLEKHAPAD